MNIQKLLSAGLSALTVSATILHGEIRTVVEHNDCIEATEEFSFKNIHAPACGDAASKAVFTIIGGTKDSNSGSLNVLNDNRVPDEEDQPAGNFFFNMATDGGRLLADLGKAVEIKEIKTYSWHPGSRGPQVYSLYVSDGCANSFNLQPEQGIDPVKCGWNFITNVDSRPKQDEPGGQYGVSISDSGGTIGKYRYLLFCFSCTDKADPFSNTFYSEIDVIEANAPAPATVKTPASKHIRKAFEADNGKYRIIIDSTEAPDLTEWAHNKLAPVLVEWYPKIVKMLPGKDFTPPRTIKIIFTKGLIGPCIAATAGARIYCAADWFRTTLDGEARGSVVHEMVHVVQQYHLAKKKNPKAEPVQGWLTEGIADFIRWHLYEPQSPGGEIAKEDIPRVRYDGQYRISAHFLGWVVEKYDRNLIMKLNATIRDGEYSEDLWKQYTGHNLPELNDGWKQTLEKKSDAENIPPAK